MYETLEAGPATRTGVLPTACSADAKRRVLTFLVSDIFGSTALNEVLGNAAWAKVLGVHDAIVRDAIWAFGGHEVKKTGDGFFAAFPVADKAVQCAITIRDRFPLRPPGYEGIELRVGIGLSEGEAIELPRDYVGLAVTLAFRLAEHARAGEVLVTGDVRGGCTGAEMVFSDLGLMPLRGFRAPAQLYRVEDALACWTETGRRPA